MTHRFLTSTSLAILIGVASVSGQAPPAASTTKAASAPKPSNVPRTPWGHPDLQGIWSAATITPFERPTNLAGRQTLSEEEAAEFEQRIRKTTNQDRRDGAGTDADVSRAYNDFWWDRGTKVVPGRQTSLVVDPPDGRVPALTPEGQKRQAARAEARRQRGPADWPEDRNLWERCITRGVPQVMLPGAYNNNYQIIQTATHVVIVAEMIHDARIVPLDGRPHLPGSVRQWMGDSRGRWDGNTLVVETTNFTDKTNYRGSAETLRLIERFTRVADDVLKYDVTIDDPKTFTKPWTVSLPATKTDGDVYEYACHEANYGLTGILKGARAEEKEAR